MLRKKGKKGIKIIDRFHLDERGGIVGKKLII
jgi:hypothetical protein